MAEEKPGGFSDMPQWPKEAKELPERRNDPPERSRALWAIVGGVVGLLTGIVVTARDGTATSGGPEYAGSVTAYVLIGIVVGIIIERVRFDAVRRRRRWGGE